jgi:membrane protein DedA with SNARE-associated domain
MSELADYVLTSLLVYGPWVLGLVTLISGIGVPVPATMILLAAGAFVQQGFLPWPSAAILAVVGAVIGDNLSYWIGRIGIRWVSPRIVAGSPWQQSSRLFQRWGAVAVFVSRFLITPLALPINLVAGSTRYAPWRYFSVVVAGEVVWVAAFVAVGYWFADYWEGLSLVVTDVSGVLAGMVLLLASVIYLLFWHRRHAGH